MNRRSDEKSISRSRSRRKQPSGRLRSLDQDETPTEHGKCELKRVTSFCTDDFRSATSGSENESAALRRRTGKSGDNRQELDNHYPSLQSKISDSAYLAAIVDQDDPTSSRVPSTPMASSIPRKLANDLSQVE